MSVSLKRGQPKIPDLKIDELTNISIDANNRNINVNTTKSHKTIPNICLFTRKINKEEINKGDILKIIHKSFNDPDYYFSEESPIKVGSKINLKKIDLSVPKEGRRHTEGRRHSFLKNPQKKANINNSKVSVSETNKSTSFGKQKQTYSVISDNKYEFIDNNALKNIFDKFKQNKINNSRDNEISISRSINNLNKSDDSHNNNYKKNKSDLNKNYPYMLFNSLNYQNRQVKANNNRERKVIKLSKHLSKKLNKNENDLLLNKIDLFKYKKEILRGINEENKPKEEKFGKFQWNMNLRRYQDFKGLRQLHVNVNSERNPFWGIIVDRNPEHIETAVRPGYDLNQKEFKKFSQNQSIINNKNCLNKVINLDDLTVNGSDLLDLEFKREMSSKGRKVLHKVFVENGKMIFNKDINNIFGEETIYKNYDNKKLGNCNNYNDMNKSEGINVLYKYNKRGKKNRIISSVSRSMEKSSNLDSFNNL